MTFWLCQRIRVAFQFVRLLFGKNWGREHLWEWPDSMGDPEPVAFVCVGEVTSVSVPV